MVELDDIQALLLTQGLMLCGRYSFLTFRDPGRGRVFLSRVVHEVSSARTASASPALYVYLGLTYNGLRALGIDEASLATFPKRSGRACQHGHRSSAIMERAIPTTGPVAWRAPTSMP